MKRDALQMKSFRLKYRYIIVFVIFIILISNYSLAFSLTKQKKDTDLQLEFSFNNPFSYTKKIKDQTFTFIDIKDCISSAEIGEPILPFYPAKILVPSGYKIKNIKILNSEFEKLSSNLNTPIAPQQEIFPLSLSKKTNSLSIKNSIYQSSEPVFKSSFTIGYTGYSRGYRICTVNLYPLNYYPNTGELLFTNKIKIKIEFEKENNIQNKFIRNNKNDERFIRNLVENPETIDSYKINQNTQILDANNYVNRLCNSNDTYEYVIITNNSLKNAQGYSHDLFDLKSHRENYSGLNSTIVTVEDIDSCNYYWNDSNVFNDSQAHIREFCKDAYLNWDTEYIALFGDWDSDNSHQIVPYRSFKDVYETFPVKTMASDMYYSHLDTDWCYDEAEGIWGGGKDGTNDLLGELFVGRIACSNAGELSNSVYKIINYDTNLTYQDEWLRSVSFFGGELGWPVTSKEYMEELRLGTDTHRTFAGFEEWNNDKTSQQFDTSERIYDEDYAGYKNLFSDSIEDDSSAIINHLGHTDVNLPLELTNWNSRYNTKPFFAFSQGCLAGRFHDAQKSGCELLICDNKDRHAYGLVLNTGYGYGSSINTNGPTQYMNAFFWDYFFNNTKDNQEEWQIGKAMLYAQDKMASTIDSPSHAWCYAWYSANLFGDPAQTIRLNSTNNAVQIDSENPSNNSVNVDTAIADISCRILDPDSDTINWSIDTSPYIGNNSNVEASGGIKTCNITNLSFSTTYQWYVNATDGITYTNNTYYFTTRSKYVPNAPNDLQVESVSKNQMNLSWNTSNRTDSVLIEYNTSYDSWEKGQGIEIYNGTDDFYVYNNLTENSSYYYQLWSWNNTDTCFSINSSSINRTTLQNQLPNFLNENPENNSQDVDVSIHGVDVYIEDSDDNTFNYSIEGKYITNIYENNSEKGIKSAEFITNLSYNTTYVWFVNATDNLAWNNRTYIFTTRNRYIPQTPNNFNAISVNRTSINLTWNEDLENKSVVEVNNVSSWNRGLGEKIYNGTGSNITHNNLDFNTEYFYQIWFYNQTDNTWSQRFNMSNATTYQNSIPDISIINPDNNSDDVSIDLSEITVNLSDLDDDDLNWTIETVSDIGNSSSFNDFVGLKNCTVSGLSYSTTYTIYVNVTDGYDYINKTFQFTTESRPSTNNNNPSYSYNPPALTKNKKPVAEINGPYNGYVGQEIIFNSAGSYDPDEDELIYNWDFGDNSTKDGTNPHHTYKKEGNFTVLLTIIDSEDNKDTDETYVHIEKNQSKKDTVNDTEEDTKKESKTLDNKDLSEIIEGKFSSENIAENDTLEVNINKKNYYLIDIDDDGLFDIFYNKKNKNHTNLSYLSKEIILIDINGNTKWDYKFEIKTNTLSVYSTVSKKTDESLYSGEILIPIFIIFIILTISFIILKKVLTSKSDRIKEKNISDYNNFYEYEKKDIFNKSRNFDKFTSSFSKNKSEKSNNIIKAKIQLPEKIYNEISNNKIFDDIYYESESDLNRIEEYRYIGNQRNYNNNFYDKDLSIDKKMNKKKKQN